MPKFNCMKKFVYISLLCFSVYSSKAQSVSKVSGRVATGKDSPVASATIILHSSKDSVIAKTAVTSSKGEYVISGVSPGSYFISASSVGFVNKNSNVFFVSAGQSSIAPVLILDKNTMALAAVTVAVKKPMIQVMADKTIFNVENSINATGSNAFELLQKSPGVSVDNNDNISLMGKNGVRIYIDGKPTQMGGSELAAYLKSVNSADIESIEMITNPSAKYDASGNAGIINIKLKKNKNYGTNGNIASGVNFGITPKYNNSLSLNFRNKKINLFSNYSNNFGRQRDYINIYRIQVDSTYNQHSYTNNDNTSNNIKAGIDYTLNTKSIIGAMVTGNFSSGTGYTNSNTIISPVNTGIPYRVLFATNTLPFSRNNIDYNANYHFADTTGRELDADADIITYKKRGNSYQPNFYRNPFTNNLMDEYIYRNNTPTDIKIYTARIDYEQPFYKGKLGYGGKITDVTTHNTFDFYNVYGNTNVKDLSLSNTFNYTENVNALYVNYNRAISKKTSIQAGLRMENTHSTGDLVSFTSSPDNVVKRNYTDLFPSGALTYTLNDNNTFNLSYSRRIDRPGYEELNPFQVKLDELSYSQGNAFLNPQYTNSFQLSNTFHNQFVTSIGFSHIKDYIAQVTDTLGNKSYLIPKNLAQQNIASISVSAPVTITKWWSLYATATAYHSEYKADFPNGTVINLKVDAYDLYAQQTFSIKKGPTFELSSMYSSPSVWGGTFKTKAFGFVDAGVQEKVLKNAGIVKLSFTDVLNTSHWKAFSNYGGTNIQSNGGWESQLLKINFSYRFGNNQVKAARERKAAEEEKSRLNSSGGIGSN